MQSSDLFQSEPLGCQHKEVSNCKRYKNLTSRLRAMASFLSARSHSTYTLAGIILFSLLWATGAALTRRPWCDEAWFASPPYNLNHHGFMGMTILDPHGFVFASYVEGIDRYTYWVMPGYLLLQAAWYKLVGLSVFSMRAISILWGGVGLLSWFMVVRWLTGERSIALLATFLLGTEQHFAFSAATGRMDMMCAALGWFALALYIRLHQNFTLALFIAGCVSAMNLFTHPNAIFGILALAVIVLYFDRNRLTLRALLLALCPFLLLSALWGLYVAQAPHLLAGQLQAQANIPHRLELPWNPWKSYRQEIDLRYGPAYGLTRSFPVSALRLVLALYGVAVIVVLTISQLWRQSGIRTLLILTALSFTLLMCFQKNWYYLIFVIPYYTALLAISLRWLWRESLSSPVLAVCLLGLVTMIHLGAVGFWIVHNEYRGRFLAATSFLKRNARPGDLIVGSGELAFELGFDGQVLDDARLGFLSGEKPEFIVIDSQYGGFWFSWFAVHEPATHRYIEDLLNNQYELVYDQTYDRYAAYGFYDQPYRILRRRGIPQY